MSRVYPWVAVVGVAVIGLLLGGCSGKNRDAFTLSVEQGDSITVGAGQTVQMSPVVTQNGTTVASPLVAWTATAEIGAITSSGSFTATTNVSAGNQKTGTITATAYGVDKIIAVTVVIGSATQLEIVPPPGVDLSRVPAGTTLTFQCTGCDQYGNRSTRFPVTPTWSVGGSIGSITGGGVFRAATAGPGKVVAVLEGVRAECPVTVVAAPPTRLSLTVAPSTNPHDLSVGDTMQCTAVAVDEDGNGEPVSGAQWSVTGGVGTITPAGCFQATTVGSGKVLAQMGSLVGELPVVVSQVVRGRLAFVKQNLYSNLYLLNANGQTQAITTGNNSYVWPDWSPDGSKLVFANTTGPNTGICAMSVGGSAQLLAPVNGLDPAWSPDGNKVAFARGMGAGEIQVISSGGAPVTTIAVSVLGAPRHPCWSPDGTKIAFACFMGTGVGDGVYLAKADGSGTPTRIYNGDAECIAWGPDAQHITVAADDSFYAIPVGGGAAQKLFDASGSLAGGFTWANGGRQVIYGQLVGMTTQLFICDVATGHKAQLTHLSDASATNPTWAP